MIAPGPIRQAHRWLGIVLTLTILANFAARALGTPPTLIVYAPLPPLALLLLSGLLLFFRPMAFKERATAKGQKRRLPETEPG